MCYSWYRCEKGIIDALSIEEKMGICLYLCGSDSKHIQAFLPALLQDVEQPVTARINKLQSDFNINAIFPYNVTLSNSISITEWLRSIITQPALFIRIRKSREKLLSILDENNIAYKPIDNNCLALPNGAQIDKLLPADSYVVQDLSSQRTGNYFLPQKNDKWYDCCSGAGGKSLLLTDIEPTVQLTVTDRRESILHNLKERFKLYHLKQPVAHIADVQKAEGLKTVLGKADFDGIICDVPCTGSGTWARTPEQLYFFDSAKLIEISHLQIAIATNTASYIRPGGRFIYITCSVFSQENEAVVASLSAGTDLILESMQVLNGVNEKADSMFVAVLKKPDVL